MPAHMNDVADRLRNQQKALAEFGLLAFRSTDLDEILCRATELVAEGLDVKLAKVLELLPGGDRLLVRAGVNWHPGVVGRVTFGAGKDSPAGHALLHNEPVVSADLDSEGRFEIPQVLIDHGVRSMINVVIAGEDAPFGVLEVDTPTLRTFDDDDIAFLQSYANLLAAAVDRHRSHRALQDSVHEQWVLIQELEHRVKNMLGLVQALAGQTTAEDAGARFFQEKLVERLQALARAENLVFEDHAQELDLRRLAEKSLEPFEEKGARFSIDGPPLALPARHGRIMALVLHELGTNSAKYGSLSVPGGLVRIGWTGGNPGGEVRFSWVESGGPAVRAPIREGFGTRLLTSLTRYELDADVSLDHTAGGLRYELSFRVEA